ncbi:unnamed protein product, partial [Timema podura]|nr:unnamed protein product [Timema podura]
MTQIVDEILKELGWRDGFNVPVADNENKALENKVEWAAKCKINHTARLEEMTDRVNALNKHMKNVIQERQQNQ